MIQFEGSNKKFNTDRAAPHPVKELVEPKGTIILSKADTDEVERLLLDRPH